MPSWPRCPLQPNSWYTSAGELGSISLNATEIWDRMIETFASFRIRSLAIKRREFNSLLSHLGRCSKIVTLLRAGNLIKHISAVLMMVLVERSIQCNRISGSSLPRFVMSEVGDVITRWVALECTYWSRTLAMLTSGFHAQGQSSRLQ